jgi:uncharacterized protein YndB with AHSA1/START domain
MSVKVDSNGRRSVTVETEVPGTLEQVWQAIATGQGITAWFCPATVEERVGGKMTMDMGPGMEAQATITAWEPPRRLAAEAPGWAPGMPAMATEWTVEARAGGKCLVRVVHSLFASTDDWDNQLEGTETGWPGFFNILRLYLTHFAGQRCSPVRVIAMIPGTEQEAWQKLTSAMGLSGAAVVKKASAPAGVPAFSGVVESVSDKPKMYDLLMRIDSPSPGALAIGSYDCGGMVMACIVLYLYGDAAAAVAEREAPRWQEWLAGQFPQPQATASGA